MSKLRNSNNLIYYLSFKSTTGTKKTRRKEKGENLEKKLNEKGHKRKKGQDKLDKGI